MLQYQCTAIDIPHELLINGIGVIWKKCPILSYPDQP